MLGVFPFSLSIANHRFRESPLEPDDRWHLMTASPVLGRRVACHSRVGECKIGDRHETVLTSAGGLDGDRAPKPTPTKRL